MSRKRMATFHTALGFMFCLTSVLAPRAAAQVETGSIVGTVFDSSRSVVPGAEVTVVNAATGVQRTVVTNERGRYNVPFLPVGIYRVRVALTGFKTAEVPELKLEVAETKGVDLTLEVGSLAEVVQVSAEQFKLQTSEASVSETIDSQKILQLPLNGRSFAQLALLVPGVNPGTPGNITIRRRRGSGGTPTAIGANGFAAVQNKFTYDGVEAMDLDSYSFSFSTSIDSIQEFKVETSTYSAAQGGAPGAFVNLVTKSGTNELHGTLWEFNRNEAVSARNTFGTTRERLNRNQFGANIGGPLIRNKLFAFFNWESSRVRQATVSRPVQVPPNDFRRGDFSSLLAQGIRIQDPETRQPFPGNIIPTSRIRTASRTFLDLVVPPAGDIGDPPFNFRLPSLPLPTDEDQYVGRVDYSISSNDSVWVRYVYNDLASHTVASTFGNDFGANDGRSQNAAVSWNHIFGPAFVAEVRAGWHRFFEHEFFGTTDKKEFDIAAGRMNLPGVASDPRNYGWPTISAGYSIPAVRTNGPRDRLNQLWDLSWTASYNQGTRVWRMGAEVYRRNWTFDEALQPRGVYSFDGRQTADRAAPLQPHQFADFLLGLSSAITLNPDFVYIRMNNLNHAYYVQTDWKVRPELTLNLGLRWDYFGRPLQRDDKAANFKFGNGNGLMVSEQFLAGSGPFGRKLVQDSYVSFGPRVGFAWRPRNNPHMVVRAGYGVYFQPEITNSYTLLGFNPPFTSARSFAGTRDNPLPYDKPELIERGTAGGGAFGAFGVLPDLKDMQAHQWNLTLQFRLPAAFLADVGYVGSYGNNLTTGWQGNRPIAINGTGTIQSRRPLSTFGGISAYGDIGWSHYESMQLKLERRVSRGVNLLGSYTFSKNLGTVGGNTFGTSNGYQDIFDENSAKTLLGLDLKHRLSTVAQWDLPELDTWSGFARALLGGWQVNTIVTLATGFATGAGYGIDTTNTGVGSFPDRVGEPVLSRGSRDAERWFNVGAFQSTPQGRWGTSSLNSFWIPGTNNVDFSVLKRFYATENHNVEFRAEFFNLFNHTQLGGPSTGIRASTVGKIRSAADPRIIQFGLKYAF